MKLKAMLLVGAVAALPLAASAQDPKPPQQRQTTQTTTTQTTNESGETKVVTTTGVVQTFEAGHSITILNDKGDAMTFALSESSEVPKTIEVGKTVTVRTTTVSGAPVVQTITTTTTTKKETKKKSY